MDYEKVMQTFAEAFIANKDKSSNIASKAKDDTTDSDLGKVENMDEDNSAAAVSRNEDGDRTGVKVSYDQFMFYCNISHCTSFW